MKKFSFCFLILLLIGYTSSATAEEISCELFGEEHWPTIGKQKTCFMNGSIAIESLAIRISVRDKDVKALILNHNKKIKFLPVDVPNTYPELQIYSALNCSIRTISKENFKGMSKLVILWLSYNRIEKINSNTFEDLTSMTELYLGKSPRFKKQFQAK